MTPTPLKPCPFCGGTPERDHHRHFINYRGQPGNACAIYCLDCEAEFSFCHEDAREIPSDEIMAMLAERWNRRATPAPTTP